MPASYARHDACGYLVDGLILLGFLQIKQILLDRGRASV